MKNMLAFLSIALIGVILKQTSAVNMTGCIYHEPYPLVFDATIIKTGEIKSPGFDEGQYPNYAQCRYAIKVSPGYIVKLTFLDIDIDPDGWCKADKVLILDGDMFGSTIGAFCGTELPPFPIYSTKNGMFLIFSTDFVIQKRGFRVRYEAILPSEMCLPDEFKCKNNRCYKKRKLCNGVDDCLDATDEENCYPTIPSYSCGISSIFPDESPLLGQDRVVGGREARPHSWPWQADLQINGNYPTGHQCGGTLIHPQWIMTAAHCLGIYIDPARWRIHLGSHNKFKKDRYEQIRLVERLVMWPGKTGKDIEGNKVNADHDIALMKLNAPVQITEAVRPACLPKQGYYEPIGTKCFATGWGRTRGTGSSDYLKQAEMYVQSEQRCPIGRRDIQICLDSRKGVQSICHGDSGGPVACKIDDKYHVLGIASVVTGSNYQTGYCGIGGGMSVFSRISNKITWINGIIETYS